jgi:hypothetical protein
MYRSRQHETPATDTAMREDTRAALREKAREINDKANQEASKELSMMLATNNTDAMPSTKGILSQSVHPPNNRDANDPVRAYGDNVHANENRLEQSQTRTGAYMHACGYQWMWYICNKPEQDRCVCPLLRSESESESENPMSPLLRSESWSGCMQPFLPLTASFLARFGRFQDFVFQNLVKRTQNVGE